MFTKFSMIATAALVAALPVTQPAMAAPDADAQTVIKAKKIVRGGETFYCFKHDVTGTRMQRRSCVTQKDLDWAGARVQVEGDEVQLLATARGDLIQKKN